jgi:hypothetical protein
MISTPGVEHLGGDAVAPAEQGKQKMPGAYVVVPSSIASRSAPSRS